MYNRVYKKMALFSTKKNEKPSVYHSISIIFCAINWNPLRNMNLIKIFSLKLLLKRNSTYNIQYSTCNSITTKLLIFYPNIHTENYK